MKSQTVAAPIMLIAIGRKMIVLTRFSDFGFSRSASTAIASPKMTVTTGTMTIHRIVLKSVCRKLSD